MPFLVKIGFKWDVILLKKTMHQRGYVFFVQIILDDPGNIPNAYKITWEYLTPYWNQSFASESAKGLFSHRPIWFCLPRVNPFYYQLLVINRLPRPNSYPLIFPMANANWALWKFIDPWIISLIQIRGIDCLWTSRLAFCFRISINIS